VGNITIIGERRYALRLWLDAPRRAGFGLTPMDVERALRDQNMQSGAGRLGMEPSAPGQQVAIPLKVESRFRDVADAENLVIKRGDNGTLVKLGDVGRVELGAESYDTETSQSGRPSAALFIYQLPGANALDTGNQVKARMEALARSFPPGLRYEVPYDSTLFVTTSLAEVTANLRDAVVIVQVIQAKLGEGMKPLPVALDAMNELATPTLSAALVQLAVFIPVCFFPGTTGIVYRQFAVTLAAAIVFSTFNALTFSRTLSALFLRAQGAPPDRLQRL
jgi:multidrug efflux pump subunit AcrB